MSAQVNVLAVLDAEIADISGLSCSTDEGERILRAREANLRKARAAVAELIAASRDAAAVLQDKAGPMEQETPRRLFAAIARVGGAA